MTRRQPLRMSPRNLPPAPLVPRYSRALPLEGSPHPARARRARSGRPCRPRPAAPCEGNGRSGGPASVFATGSGQPAHAVCPRSGAQPATGPPPLMHGRRFRRGRPRPSRPPAPARTAGAGGLLRKSGSSAHDSAGGRPSGAGGQLRASPSGSERATPGDAADPDRRVRARHAPRRAESAPGARSDVPAHSKHPPRDRAADGASCPQPAPPRGPAAPERGRRGPRGVLPWWCDHERGTEDRRRP